MIIVDEAHERSKQIDLILALLKRELPKYPHLKLIIASATIDAKSFEDYFQSSTSVSPLDFSDCQKTFGYEEFPWKLSDLKDADFEESLFENNKSTAKAAIKTYEREIVVKLTNEIINIIETSEKGGIVGFLHGEEHIKLAVESLRQRLRDRKDIKIFPLYTKLGTELTDAALAPIKERRIVIATNIAETSLTIPDVVFIVDSGLIKQSDWNPITCRIELNVKFHSKAGCKQRWGRAGRVQKGYVHKLYDENQFKKYFPNHTPPEIKRSNADDLILSAIASGVSDFENFSMLEKPEPIEFARALNVVKRRGILDDDLDFTEEGNEIYRLSKAIGSVIDGVEGNSAQRALDIASFLILADRYACLIEAATVICMMSKMGNALYRGADALLEWDKELNLISKDYRIRLIDSFKAGCIDDLDFACKLYSSYEGYVFGHQFSNDYKSWFTEEYSVNVENFNSLKETRNKLIEVFNNKTDKKSIRKLDLKLVARLRVLAALSWPDRVISIRKEDGLLFESTEYNIIGTISENCAGDWKDKGKAIVGMFDKNENEIFFDGEKITAPVANFLIKCVELVPSKNVVDIIIAFRVYSFDASVKNSYSNCLSDIAIRINEKIEIDMVKPSKISKTFPIDKENLNSTNNDDIFIEIHHNEIGIERNSEFEVEIARETKPGKTLIVEQWIRRDDNIVALVDSFSIFDKTIFSNNRFNKIIAIVKRPIFDIKVNTGSRIIVGFIVSVGDYHFSIPVENISIEFENDFLMELVGQKITLFKTSVTPNTEQQLFSIIPIIEKERQELLKLDDVIGIVTRISASRVFINLKAENGIYNQPLTIPTSAFKNNFQYLDVGGEIKLKVELKNEINSIVIDCLTGPGFTDEVSNEITQLLLNIKNNTQELLKFTAFGIGINETEISNCGSILFENFNAIANKYPILRFALRKLYATSWELKGTILEIRKAFEDLSFEVAIMKSNAKLSSYLVTQNILKQFKWHDIRLSENSNAFIKNEIDMIWKITHLKRDIDYKKSTLIPRFYLEISEIPKHQTLKIANKSRIINDINSEILRIEEQIMLM